MLIRMSRSEASKLGRLTIVGTTSGWNHGGEDIYELVLTETGRCDLDCDACRESASLIERSEELAGVKE